MESMQSLCGIGGGSEKSSEMNVNNIPRNWPDHFEKAIKLLNNRILQSFKFLPKELLLGMVVNTAKMQLNISIELVRLDDMDMHIVYVAQQQLDGYSEVVQHAEQRKETYNKKVMRSNAGPVTFHPGQLVQVFQSNLMNMMSLECKLMPMWSNPRQVVEHNVNSYRLEMLDGAWLEGEYSVRRLREFVAREGMDLAEVQKVFMERKEKEEEE